MTHLDIELKLLKDECLEMFQLVNMQLKKGLDSLLNYDKSLAREVNFYEKRVNALELKIDRDCESIFALFNPLAIDLRFVLACLKINSNLALEILPMEYHAMWLNRIITLTKNCCR